MDRVSTLSAVLSEAPLSEDMGKCLEWFHTLPLGTQQLIEREISIAINHRLEKSKQAMIVQIEEVNSALVEAESDMLEQRHTIDTLCAENENLTSQLNFYKIKHDEATQTRDKYRSMYKEVCKENASIHGRESSVGSGGAMTERSYANTDHHSSKTMSHKSILSTARVPQSQLVSRVQQSSTNSNINFAGLRRTTTDMIDSIQNIDVDTTFPLMQRHRQRSSAAKRLHSGDVPQPKVGMLRTGSTQISRHNNGMRSKHSMQSLSCVDLKTLLKTSPVPKYADKMPSDDISVDMTPNQITLYILGDPKLSIKSPRSNLSITRKYKLRVKDAIYVWQLKERLGSKFHIDSDELVLENMGSKYRKFFRQRRLNTYSLNSLMQNNSNSRQTSDQNTVTADGGIVVEPMLLNNGYVTLKQANIEDMDTIKVTLKEDDANIAHVHPSFQQSIVEEANDSEQMYGETRQMRPQSVSNPVPNTFRYAEISPRMPPTHQFQFVYDSENGPPNGPPAHIRRNSGDIFGTLQLSNEAPQQRSQQRPQLQPIRHYQSANNYQSTNNRF